MWLATLSASQVSFASCESDWQHFLHHKYFLQHAYLACSKDHGKSPLITLNDIPNLTHGKWGQHVMHRWVMMPFFPFLYSLNFVILLLHRWMMMMSWLWLTFLRWSQRVMPMLRSCLTEMLNVFSGTLVILIWQLQKQPAVHAKHSDAWDVMDRVIKAFACKN